MTQQTGLTLTQAELVQRLHAQGCDDVNVRRIADWRKNDVLPPFDITGGGRGRGTGGRDPNVWTEGDAVLNQALWVYRLLRDHSSFVDLYLPLWLLGFPIPMNRIRQGLAKPLETTSNDITCVIDGENSLEDAIDDAAYEFSEGVRRANWNLLDMPQEVIAAILNILLNSAYNLKDEPFEHAVESVGEWERSFQRKCLEFLDDSKAVARAEQLPGESGIFRNAEFVNHFLSVPRLRQVVAESTDADLIAVGRDIAVAREIMLEVKRLLAIVLRYAPPEMKLNPNDLAETILSAGSVSLWVDLSLRHSGYGAFIEELLTLVLNSLRNQSTEDVEKEIAMYDLEIRSAFNLIMELGTWLASNPGFEPSMQLAS